MDPRDASTLHVVHKGGRSVWQTHDGRTTLGRKEPPKVNSHLMFEILKKYADRERWKNCTYYPLLLLLMRRCSLPSDWLATVSNPAAASRCTALYTPHISVTRSLAIAEGLRDLANSVSILVIGCPTEPANLAPFQKCPVELRYTEQSLTENSMLCYGPLVSELGVQSAWCHPNPVIGGLCRPAPRLRRLWWSWRVMCNKHATESLYWFIGVINKLLSWGTSQTKTSHDRLVYKFEVCSVNRCGCKILRLVAFYCQGAVPNLKSLNTPVTKV